LKSRFLFVTVALSIARAGGALTLEQVLSAPYVAEITASPRGAVAWVSVEKGVRNIWLWAPGDKEGHLLTHYTEDDGQEILDVQWTPDLSAVVFTRGGVPNRKGEIPNPTSDPKAMKQQVLIVELGGGEPRVLGEGHSPAVSPLGDLVAWQKGDVIFSASLGGGEAKPLFQARGRNRRLRWAPDGKALAFVSDRGDHSFIGVYRPAERSLRYLDPSFDRDVEMVWSPDSLRLAIVRLPGLREDPQIPTEQNLRPWSIRIADPSTGNGREIFRSGDAPEDSYTGLASESDLFWSAGDRIVFASERTGWRHLYAIPAAGGPPKALTQGDCEVEGARLTFDGKRVIYYSNCLDTDRRHIWTVGVEGGSPQKMTSGKGIEWSPWLNQKGELVFLGADAHSPGRPKLLAQGAAAPAELAPPLKDFPAASLVEPQAVTLEAEDGVRFNNQLFLPPGLKPGEKRPAILFFHGGSRRQMLLGWHYREYYHNAYAMNQYLASRGYIVLSVNYRSGIGYGRAFREPPNFGFRGGSEYHDVLAAALWVRSRPDVNPESVGLWGGSYGGYLTALGLARNSNLFAAGVDLHGVHDWSTEVTRFTPSSKGEAMDAPSRTAFESSPVASVGTWRSPVLLIQGDDDRNVSFSQSVDLLQRLRRKNVEVEVLVFPDEVHDFLMHAHWLSAYRSAADFFDRHLRK